jgi:hypothetical protein
MSKFCLEKPTYKDLYDKKILLAIFVLHTNGETVWAKPYTNCELIRPDVYPELEEILLDRDETQEHSKSKIRIIGVKIQLEGSQTIKKWELKDYLNTGPLFKIKDKDVKFYNLEATEKFHLNKNMLRIINNMVWMVQTINDLHSDFLDSQLITDEEIEQIDQMEKTMEVRRSISSGLTPEAIRTIDNLLQCGFIREGEYYFNSSKTAILLYQPFCNAYGDIIVNRQGSRCRDNGSLEYNITRLYKDEVQKWIEMI